MARRKTPRGEAQLAFEAIAIEGGLLAPEWLSRVAQLAAEHQSEPDYRTPKGLNLRDEIGRYWRIAQAHWSDFARGRVASAEPRALARQFVLALLRESFGFGSLTEVPPVELDGRVYPVGFCALGRRVPVVVAPAASGLDTLAASFGDESRRRSAFGLVQEYLNADEAALWGIVSDGVALRIARDNASLTRPAWIEADVSRIFTEERFADFAALWLLAHESRFGKADHPATECPLEVWREAGRQQGTRAREKLRHGVEQALLSLGQGFLAHPENQAVRAALQSGELTTKDYFNQLLRLVYRIIFLLTVEERGLLHPDGADRKARALYASGYSLGRLRERCVKRSAHDRFGDLWQATKIVFRGLTAGESRLGLPALAGIFAKTQCPTLDASKLENRALLTALFRLSWIREDSGLSRVNWRDMGPEELGSVYESLLELVPQITQDGRQFSFATGGETKGNARKTSGSYYTPDSLVQVLLDSALEPVVESTLVANPDKPVEALLQLSVVDPACGSGHFLLAAARRLAAHVARLRANGTPSAPEYRHVLREVIARCIYGVDLNLMAVELCKVSLWMEAVEPGLPLTFLDSHIQHGNALLGTTPELMAKGIPDTAWDAIEGDDRKVASALKKRNKKHGVEQQTAWSFVAQPVKDEPERLKAAIAELEAASDASPEALAKKESQWDGILGSAEYRHQKLVADAWCAAFVWPKQPGPLAEAAPTNEVWRQIRDGQGQPAALTVKSVAEVAEQYRFFHWHLQFPQVFAKGGFAVVLGNPPWDSLLFREEEFFAGPRPDIAQAATAAARKKLVARLQLDEPALYAAYRTGFREIDGVNAFVRSSGRYPLCGAGRVNLFALFAEHNRAILRSEGRAGFVVPTGIATDETTKELFRALVTGNQLDSLYDFRNHDRLFYDVGHRRFKFCLMTIANRPIAHAARFVFFAESASDLRDPTRQFTLSPADISLLNPHTGTCPTFRTRRDADLSMTVYRRMPVVTASAWTLVLRRLLNSADDSGNFEDAPGPDRLRLYEAKYLHHYDHRWLTVDADGERPLTATERIDAGFFIRPRYWYPAQDARERFGVDWKHSWVFAWRDIARSTDERTFIASVVPSLAVPHTAKVMFVHDVNLPRLATLIANVAAFVFDYVARQKIGGTHMSAFIVEQLPLVAAAVANEPLGWSGGVLLRDWVFNRVLELTYTAWDLEAFAHDVGYDGPPFRWDPERRFLLRCELDAAFFHLYGLSRDDTDYVMDTFPIVRKNDEKAHGEYRTKRVILEIYDAMAEAARTGIPYQTRLDPLPADPRVAHPPREDRRVIPLPVKPAAHPQPAISPTPAGVPELAAIASNAWARPRTMARGEIRAVILAVLKANGAPMDRRQARLAALLCLEPHLLASMLERTEKAQWARVVGGDATKVASAAITETSQEWGAALTGLRGRERVLEDLQHNTWALGTGTEAIDTSGWPEGRAGFVVNVLRRLQASMEVDAIVLKLPTIVQQWLANAA